MTHVVEAGLIVKPDARFAVIVARWNDLVTERLLDAAVDTLKRHGAVEDNIGVYRVPGSFELPQLAQRLAIGKNYQAIICLGAVIQGETQHHDYINHAVAIGLTQAGQSTGVPVLFGVLTCENMDQALNRAGGKAGNKGTEAALAAIEMVNLMGIIK